MSGHFDKKSKADKIDRSNSNDEQVVYNDATHVCLWKLCPAVDKYKELPLGSHARFHIRLYAPKFVYTAEKKQVKKVVLMINGLNEDYYTLYDQIGKLLCQRGMAAVLVPMPEHLNRRKEFRDGKERDPGYQKKIFANLMREPSDLYKFYKQFAREIDELCDFIIHAHDGTKNEKIPDIYRRIFDAKVRISILGFSMGGLAALSFFLANRKANKIELSSCFLLNSGIRLGDIKLPKDMVEREDWDKLILAISKNYKENVNDLYSGPFGMIYLGNRPDELKEDIRPYLNKILFMFSGADSVIPMRSIGSLADDAHGLSIFSMPSLSHFLAIDKGWNHWLSFIVNLIAEFEENASYKHIDKEEMLDLAISLKNRCGLYRGPCGWYPSKVKGDKDKEDFSRLRHHHLAFFPNHKALISEAIYHEFKKNKLDKDEENRRYCTSQGLSPEQVEAILKRQVEYCRDGRYVRAGKIAKKLGYPLKEL